MAPRTSLPISVTPVRGVSRAELVFGGIDQAGPSFEGRVFLNNPDADEGTPLTPETGYAGSFHVYGYGAPAPPAVAEARATRDGPVAPIEKRVHADEGALRTAIEGSDELTVTVVPVAVDAGGATPERPFENVEVVFDRAATEP